MISLSVSLLLSGNLKYCIWAGSPVLPVCILDGIFHYFVQCFADPQHLFPSSFFWRRGRDLFHYRRSLDVDVSITVLPMKKGVLHGFSVGCSRDPGQILPGRLLFTSPCVLRHKRKISKKLMELGLEALLWSVSMGRQGLPSFLFLLLESF